MLKLKNILCMAAFACTNLLFATATVKIWTATPLSSGTFSFGGFGLSEAGNFVLISENKSNFVLFSKNNFTSTLSLSGPFDGNDGNIAGTSWVSPSNPKLWFSKDYKAALAIMPGTASCCLWKIEDLINEKKDGQIIRYGSGHGLDSMQVIPSQTGNCFYLTSNTRGVRDCYIELNEKAGAESDDKTSKYELKDLLPDYNFIPNFTRSNFYNFVVAQSNFDGEPSYFILNGKVRFIPKDVCHIGSKGEVLLAKSMEPQEQLKYYRWRQDPSFRDQQHGEYVEDFIKNEYFERVKDLKPGTCYTCNNNKQFVYMYHDIEDKKLVFLVYNHTFKKWSHFELTDIPYKKGAENAKTLGGIESVFELTPLGSHKAVAILSINKDADSLNIPHNTANNSKEHYLLDLNSKNPSAMKVTDFLEGFEDPTPSYHYPLTIAQNIRGYQENIFQVLYKGRGDYMESGTYYIILTNPADQKQFRIVEIAYPDSVKILEGDAHDPDARFRPSSADTNGNTIVGSSRNSQTGKVQSHVISETNNDENQENLEWVATNFDGTIFAGNLTATGPGSLTQGSPQEVGYIQTTSGTQQLDPYHNDGFVGLTSRVTAMHPLLSLILGESSSENETRACIWRPDLSGISEDSDNLSPILLPTPKDCKFSSSRAISLDHDEEYIVGQYRKAGDGDILEACSWLNNNFQPLKPCSIGDNYSNAVAVGKCQGYTFVLGQSGTLNGMDINARACVWVNEIPYYIGELGESSIASAIATEREWIFGSRGGEHHRLEGISGGEAFIYRGTEKGVENLKKWLIENYEGISNPLGNISLETVTWVSPDGNIILGTARDIDGKLKGYKVDLQEAQKISDALYHSMGVRQRRRQVNRDGKLHELYKIALEEENTPKFDDILVDTNHLLSMRKHLNIGGNIIINRRPYVINNMLNLSRGLQLISLGSHVLDVLPTRPELDQKTNDLINCAIIADALR